MPTLLRCPHIFPICFLVVVVLGEFILPTPNGRYGVNLALIELTDSSRSDRYNASRPRKLMTSMFYPTMELKSCKKPSTVPYMSNATAHLIQPLLETIGIPDISGVLSALKLSVCDPSIQPPGWSASHHHKPFTFPVLLFSHGFPTSRLLSSLQAQAVASFGYVVITIDHPYDAWVVEYRDGSVVQGNYSLYPSNTALDEEVRVRSQDISFVIDQLRDSNSFLCRRDFRFCSLDQQNMKIGVYGHSMGGATAIRANYDDERISGAINLDCWPYGFKTSGSMFPDMPTFSLPAMTSPTLLFNLLDDVHAAPFTAIWHKLAGWKRRLVLNDAEHWTFTDLPVLVDTLGIRDQLAPTAAENIGTLSGERSSTAVVKHIVGFMDMLLKHECSKLFCSQGSQHPEVDVKWTQSSREIWCNEG